ncbi:MAG: prephenate dehydrogenase [Congregibacter sp.]
MSLPQAHAVGFAGLGLIGGSLALGLRESGFAASVTAWDRDPAVLEEGRSLGVIDVAVSSFAELLDAVDIVVIAVPTLACEALLLEALRSPGRARCVTDVASVKGPLCAAAACLPLAQRALYVPGHPIAGSESSGVAAAQGGLFQSHRVILSPSADTKSEALALALAMWASVGADVQQMSVKEHDSILARTSHLPHVLAYALVDALAQSSSRDDIFRFAAGGFRDFTRIASSNPEMWRDIAIANRDALLDAIDDFSRQLTKLRGAVDAGDGDALEHTFRAAKEARDEFSRALQERQAGESK